MKKETIEQMEDFNKSLARLQSGDMTLVDGLGNMQLVGVVPETIRKWQT